MAAQLSLFEKIWESHLVAQRPDGRDLIYIDRHVLHDLHGPHAFKKLADKGRQVRRPDLTFSAIDHTVATTPGRDDGTNPRGADFIRAMRERSRSHGIHVFDLNDDEHGICHVVAPELGMVLPGATHAVPDSHAGTVGGLGALAFGCGTSELEHILATQTMAIRRPKSMRIMLNGHLEQFVSAKDVALKIISVIGSSGGQGYVFEYAGPVVSAMEIEARMTLCNLSVEMGARSGLVAPDQKTYKWLAGRRWAPAGADWQQALEHWASFEIDDGADFDNIREIDCDALAPQITWGTDPGQVIGVDGCVPEPMRENCAVAQRALDYMGLVPGKKVDELKVDRVFIGSCTNSRLSDLEAAADIVRGRKVASGVEAWVVPGSQRVKRDAESLGLDRVFCEAGFQWRESGCSMCAALNGDTGKPGERCVSTTNRNFENRQGRGVRTHLASPATAAASAVTGRITDVRTLMEGGA